MLANRTEFMSTVPSSEDTSSRLPRATGARRELTAAEESVLLEAIVRCERILDDGAFFRRLAAGGLEPAAFGHVLGQYGHFRVQLHHWIALCLLKAPNAADPAQRRAVMALADHLFTDLRDDHDQLFQECLQQFGFPPGTLRAEPVGAATRAYIQSFIDDHQDPLVTWAEALAALGGRELSVALRNRRLLKYYFAPRGLPAPTWLTLHAELEVDHFIDMMRPMIAGADHSSIDCAKVVDPILPTVARHVEYLDALLLEHEAATGSILLAGRKQ